MYYSIQFQNLIWFILLGGVAGGLANLLISMGGMGILADITVGVGGAFLGGLFHWIFYRQKTLPNFILKGP